MTLTVAICTFNRSALLANVLDRLILAGDATREPWRLLVVDNSSTDGTQAVLASFEGRLPLTHVIEAKQGHSAARNRALAEVTTDALVFTDDDVSIPGTWIAAWQRAFRAAPDAGWFGGPILPSWPDGKPAWIVDARLEVLGGVLVLHRPSEVSRAYRVDESPPVGANFGFRMAVPRRIGGFREDLGMSGATRGLGDETEWLRRAIDAGFTGWFAHDAGLEHPIPGSRLTLGALWRHGVASGTAHQRMFPDHRDGSLVRAANQLMRGSVQWVRGRGDRFRQCVMNAGREVGRRRDRRRVAPAPPGDGSSVPGRSLGNPPLAIEGRDERSP